MIEQPTTAHRPLRPVDGAGGAVPAARDDAAERAWRTVAGIESATTAIPAARPTRPVDPATTAIPAVPGVESATTAIPARSLEPMTAAIPVNRSSSAAERAAELVRELRAVPVPDDPTSLVPVVRPVDPTAIAAVALTVATPSAPSAPTPDDGSAIEETSMIRLAKPVFVDGTGKRTRRTKVLAYTAASACVAMLALVGISLAAGQHTPMLQIPLLGGSSTATAETKVEEPAEDVAAPAAPVGNAAATTTTPAPAVAPAPAVRAPVAPVVPEPVVTTTPAAATPPRETPATEEATPTTTRPRTTTPTPTTRPTTTTATTTAGPPTDPVLPGPGAPAIP
ncbi:MAG: hypothetical protein OJJ54_09675 [Pseudonocardia sp.]|nr:hypothetical protein [Pseudonocardia sp.]